MRAQRDEPIHFGPFCLDRGGARLLRAGRPVALTPKAFDLLQLLASKPGKLITKEELLAAIWPDVLVSDASIKVCVSEVRKALDDGAKTPQYIETVHRRGYRFIGIGSAKTAKHATAPKPAAPRTPAVARRAPPASPIAGRDAEMKRLLDRFDGAALGDRQCIFLTGSPGSGKTALIQAFVDHLRGLGVSPEHSRGAASPRALGQDAQATFLIGHCFEQFGTREPYLPMWEAIRTLAQQREYAPLESLLARHAAALAAGSETSSSTNPTTNTQLASARRVLGEMADAIEALAADTPLVFLLEDVQWIDHSTLDLLTALARRRREAKLMVIATFRPAEMQAAADDDHPLREVVQQLLTARLAEELPLGQLDEAAVAAYLSRRFDGAALPKSFAHRLHERTDGHPLFLVHVVDDLIERRVLARHDDGWKLDADTAAWQAVLETQVPPSVRAMIELQLRRLAPREQQVLGALAVAGVECSAAAAAAATGEADIVVVEQVCDDLARRHRFLAPAGVDEWPDGTVSSRYRFVHELYHNVVYERLGVARRTQLHRALGLRMEAAWGDRAAEESPALAMHFELGRDWPRAVRYLRHAGDAAARQYAHREAAEYFRRGLAALERLPNDDARRTVELPMLMSLGLNMQVTQGCAAPAVEHVFARAEALIRASDAAGDITKIFPLLWGIWVFHKVRSDLAQADALARRLLAMAHQAGDAALLMQAHQAMCVTALCLGNPRLTIDHMQQGGLIYDPARHATNTIVYGQDPGVATLAAGAVALCICDRADEAVGKIEQALALAKRLNQPTTTAFALHFAAMLHQLRGDAPQTERYATDGIALATEEGFSFWRAGGMVLHGWALTVQHQHDHRGADALAEIRTGLSAWISTGSRTYLAYFLGLQADALIRRHRQGEAIKALEEALALACSLPEGLYESELHRLMAACLADDNTPAAREHTEAAQRIAVTQCAPLFGRHARGS
jgi:DNA-binding winged helix-turn-helix (wHTH) protein/predicted ATPase